MLGLDGVAYGLEGTVPAGVTLAVVHDGAGALRVAEVDGGGARRTTAGDLLVPVAGVLAVDAGTGAAADVSDVAGGANEADRMRRLVRLLGAARLAGATDGLLALGVDYVKAREQFGKPIGAFQAVAFRLADAAIASDGTSLLVRKAAWVADPAQGGDGAPPALFASMAWAKAVDAARAVATHVHQCMGGYGFALEYDCQLFSRRMRSWTMRLGPTGPELAEVARTLLDPPRRDEVRWLWHHDHGVATPRWTRDLDHPPTPPGS